MNARANQGPTSGLTPHITIRDKRAKDAIEFYTRAFGATAHVHINGASLMMHDDFPEYSGKPSSEPACIVLHLQVDDTDTWYQRAVDAGAISVMAPQDMFWGDRYAQVRDPFGHLWAIGTPLG